MPRARVILFFSFLFEWWNFLVFLYRWR